MTDSTFWQMLAGLDEGRIAHCANCGDEHSQGFRDAPGSGDCGSELLEEVGGEGIV